MAEVPFYLHLGGGLYLDSNGDLHQEVPPPGRPVYQAPFSLPVEPKSIANTLNDVKKALKDIDKDAAVLRKFEEYGLPYRLLGILSAVGKIAGMVAPVFAVASFAVDLLKLFGVLKEGPSALEALVTKRFDELDAKVDAIAKLIKVKDLRNGRTAVASFTAAAKNYASLLGAPTPTIAQLEADRQQMLNEHASHIDGISALLDPQTWLSEFDPAEHSSVWGLLEPWLFTFPDRRGSPGQPARLPPKESVLFDHRLMLPLASYAAQSYLAAIRAMVPEYRTTGEFRENLRLFADQLSDLADGMRRFVLARTVYTAADFAWPISVSIYDVVWSGGLPGSGTPRISDRCGRWPVGALDLRYHDNNFFRDFLDQLWRGEFLGFPHTTKCAGMDFRWIPPAVLQPGPIRDFVIANPEECAAAANAQAAKDFGDLLSVSGYTDLLELAMLFRHESTEPECSQTVRGHKPGLVRKPEASSTVTVESERFFTSVVLHSPAIREPALCSARVEIWTQPVHRARPVEYRVRLRTLRSISGKHWREPEYRNYLSAEYEDDPAHPGFLRLAVREHELAIGVADLLPVWASSPRERRLLRGVAHLKADTFDWWIPVKPPFELSVDVDESVAVPRAMGSPAGRQPSGFITLDLSDRISPGNGEVAPGALRSDRSSAGAAFMLSPGHRDLLPDLLWKESPESWDGQHRELQQKNVAIEYELEWLGDRLWLTLRNDPRDRNYVVHVVVEEKLFGSGQVLHTSVPVPVSGQLTHVPQRFLDAEREELERARRLYDYFVQKYAKSRRVGPSDPVVGWIRPGDLMRPEALQRFADLARENAPEILQEAIETTRSYETYERMKG